MQSSHDMNGTPDRAPSVSAKSLLNEFIQGATQISPVALIGTILVAAALLGACVVLITPHNLARINEGYFMASPDDSYASLTGKTLQRRYQGFPDHSVLILGTSAIHHGFPDADVVEGYIKENEPLDVHVVPLVGYALSMWEMLNVLGEVKGPINGVVVLGLSAGSFAREDSRIETLIEHPRLPFLSEPYKDEIEKLGIQPPHQLGVFFLDYSGFFTSRIRCTLNLLTGPQKFRRTRDKKAPLPDPGKWDRAMAVIGARLATYDDNHQHMFDLLADLIAVVHSKGDNQVVLLEPPMNPVAIHDMEAQPVIDRFRRDIAAFAKAHGVEFWDLHEQVNLDPDDFADWYHLRDTPTRERYAREFARRIAELMSRSNASRGGGAHGAAGGDSVAKEGGS